MKASYLITSGILAGCSAIVLILTSGGCLGAQAPATPLPPNTWASLGPEG
jgi:hypothetical protein